MTSEKASRLSTGKLKGIILIITGLILAGCSYNGEPRVRLGSYATATPGTKFLDAKHLGKHSYGSFWGENNGIVYTCKAGHIDIAHVRIGADNVRYLYNKLEKNLINNETDIRFKLNVEPSSYFVTLTYPDNWENLSQKEREDISEEVAMELSQYLTFTMTTWHEVLTWFGYKCMAFLPEQPSAFSWEDIYSNLLGIRIGIEAVKDKENSFNNAVTSAILRELEDLQVQSADTARKAAEKMRGVWYNGILLVDMKIRNFDIGMDDGYVTPILVPGICENVSPRSYPVPTLEKFDKYGFKMDFEVQPKEFEKDRILKIVYPKGNKNSKIEPAKYLPIIVNHIKNGRKNVSIETSLQN